MLGKERFDRGYEDFSQQLTEKISEKLFLRPEDFVILGRDGASMNDRIPPFRHNVVSPSSEVTLRCFETSVAEYPLTKRHIT